ncbi:cysteine desulfurase family protein [Rhodocytophaga aerolata]|uniref:Cysteine desulfurase family protein n=1 Tax=Rhodocytophaga aerolata TaxID=455078 RepID=A0ABT8R898_9BACT|nr:cysteine desulfurase family protein [Rhodocytophaga aerolata]MDO1448322.1 cysteine desulfurase family protein [Rhodocytophaga aerolata]
MRVYFDNAATTPLDKEVLDAMIPYMMNQYGNPSSIHSHGREARAAIEKSRKTIAALLNTSPSEIFFTSGGTEADNTAIRSTVETLNITHAITSPIEHHAVLHTLEELHRLGKIQVSFVRLDEKGHVEMNHLEELLKTNPRSLVSLMHANNEVGNLTNIEAIGELCSHYKAVFHSDTVQTMGHYRHDLRKLNINFIVGAAHKFHGPKGVGFLYINNSLKIQPFITGGSQERNMRGGTENVYGIIGLAKALEVAYRDMAEHQQYIQSLKSRMIEKLKTSIEDIYFNGDSANAEKSLYTVLNVNLPPSELNDMLLFNLDIQKISASGGSACASGTNIGSHVLAALNCPPDRTSVRFSFSKYNTPKEVDYVVETLAEMYKNIKVA